MCLLGCEEMHGWSDVLRYNSSGIDQRLKNCSLRIRRISRVEIRSVIPNMSIERLAANI